MNTYTVIAGITQYTVVESLDVLAKYERYTTASFEKRDVSICLFF